MIESKIKFSILITTKNRLVDLKVTLENLSLLINNEEVECLVYDDASTDGTFDFIKRNYPKIILLRNNKTLGLIHNRNILLEKCNGEYAISIDDDLHFLTPENPLEVIETFFLKKISKRESYHLEFIGIKRTRYVSNISKTCQNKKFFRRC
ncbi:glycosyltransferase family 2 protein [Flavobacterium oreochromis]|uniref:glycosyltransferase family 2 protein n=1 Tax=Flavobacterium oreochromis TaxID=2906078 RepID=UPI00216466B2|nr:glycosyltransferase [Flavobacterium oreochromis]